jgi:hypothetical protein
MALWPFKKKPPTAPLTLNRHFYLSVLSAPGPLPPLLQIINPDGSNGAVKGFGAPLEQGASKDVLNQPLQHSPFALASFDRRTVIQMDVFAREEVPQFQLPSGPALLEAANLTGERLRRAQQAGHLTTLAFKGYSQDAYEAVQFMLDLARRLAGLSEGVVADPLAETYRLPEEMRLPNRLDLRIDMREVASIKLATQSDGIWASTRGLAKFNLPEIEMYGLGPEQVEIAVKMLVAAGQQALIGMPMKPGETAFSVSSPLEVVDGVRNRDEWGDRPTVELRDRGAAGAARGVKAWEEQGF